MSFIQGPADLEYVNQQMEAHILDNAQSLSDELSRRTHEQVRPSAAFSANGINLRRISPNSGVSCHARCGVKEPHNLGKFFRDGIQPGEPENWEYETSTGERMAPVSHFFNFTVPPMDIVEAYLRMTEGKASVADRDMVRDYQMNHMYSPIVSECPTPRGETSSDIPRIICSINVTQTYDEPSLRPPAEQLRVEETQTEGWRKRELKRILTTESDGWAISEGPVLRQEQPLFEEMSKRSHFPNPDAVFNTSTRLERDVETCIMGQDNPNEGCAFDWGNSSLARNDYHVSDKSSKSLLDESRLRNMQLSIQESVLANIAQEAIKEHYSKRPKQQRSRTKQGGFDIPREPSSTFLSDYELPENLDRELEVMIGLIKKLQSSLDQEDFGDLFVENGQSYKMDANTEHEIVGEILQILKRSFRLLLTKFVRPYRPTGTTLSDREIKTLFQKQLEIRESLQSR